MKAKEYLQQVKMIDVQIDQDKERRSEATQTDKSKEQISKEIEKLIMIKNQVIHEIRGLHNADYVQILYKIYVENKTLKESAREMKRSYNYVLSVHKKALAAFCYKKMIYENRHFMISELIFKTNE